MSLAPNGYIAAISRVYGSSVYRKVTEVVSDAGISSYQADKEMCTGDFSVCYQFLNGDDADYSGMAGKVRSLMEEYGLINQTDEINSTVKLDVMMGATEKTMLGTRYRSTTTLAQLTQMLEQLPKTNGGISAVLKYHRWF